LNLIRKSVSYKNKTNNGKGKQGTFGQGLHRFSRKKANSFVNPGNRWLDNTTETLTQKEI